MRSLGFYALGSAWLFALIAPLVLFYFLKLKRPRVLVPSLVLWRQILSDRRVNSPFQRFKRNILLLLQLLLLIALILAAMQPFWRGRAARVRRIPVLIDCSASMAALDKPRGSSRLDVAKEQVRQIVNGLLPDQELCLISFSRTARKRTDFTNNKRVLRGALDQLRVEDVPSNIEDALRMAQALAQGAAFDEVLLFSDGNFPTRAHFDLSFTLNYQRLPGAGPNVGITSLNAKRWAEGRWDVFALLEGSPEAEGPVTVELSQDGEVIGTEYVTLAKGQAERMVFAVPGDRPASLKVALVAEGFDSLACDNVAFLDLPTARSLQAYVPPDMEAYRHALTALTAVSLHTDDGEGRLEAAYDLVVTDRAADMGVQGRTCCYVGLVPDDLAGLVTIGQEGSQVVDWRRSSPVLYHVELSDLVILDQPRSGEGVGDGDYEKLGYEVIIHGDRGPLLLQKREGDKLRLYFLFHTDRSTLTYRVGFPVLVSNVVQVALEQAGLAGAHGARTGTLPERSLRPVRTYRVEGPDGRTREHASDEDGVLSGIAAPRVGYYRVSEGGQVVARTGAALLAPAETTLASVEEIQFAEEVSVAASAGGARTDRALWPVFAMLGFCLLVGEWWYYHRRPGGFAP